MKQKTIGRVLFTIAAAAMLSTSARAQTVDIPYQGWITQGDQPCTSPLSMVFSLYDVSTGGTAVWWIEYTNVAVSDGAFSLVLPVPEAVVLGNEELYLEIAVEGTTLVNRQRIYPAMYAARDMPGTSHFYVKSGADSGIAITDGYINYSDPSSEFRAGIHNDLLPQGTYPSVGPALMIVGNRAKDGPGGEANVLVLHNLRAWSDLVAGRNLSVPGNASVNNLQVGGGTLFSRMEAGVEGNCSVDDGVPSAGTVSFSTPFSSPPLVFLQPRVAAVGCTSVRTRAVTTTAFEYRAWVGDVPASCSCIYWLAIGR